MLDDPGLTNLIHVFWRIDVLHSLVPQRIGAVVKIIRERLYLWRCFIPEVALIVSISVVTRSRDLKLQWRYVLRFLLLDVDVCGLPSYGARHQVVVMLIKSAIDGVRGSWWVLRFNVSLVQAADDESEVKVVR